MAINDDLHRYKDVLKKQISHAFRIYLSIAIILSPLYLMNTANAASLGGWTTGNSIVQGASVILNGSKEVILNGAKKIANGTAKITPPPSSVAKALAGGAAAVALDLAVKELLGGVDYVLDPANNSITYKKKASFECDSSGSTCTHAQYIFIVDISTKPGVYNYKYFPDLISAGVALCLRNKASNNSWDCSSVTKVPDFSNKVNIGTDFGYIGQFLIDYKINPAYDPTAVQDNQPKSLPLTTVAQKVIDQAVSGSPQAQQAIKAAADTIVAEAETDSTKARPIVSQFEQTSTIETTEKSTSKSESTTTTNTANPEESTTKTDTTTEFPVFCGWAPTICEAANVVIQKPAEWAENIKAAYDDAVDYFKEEPTNKEPEELEIEQPQFEAEQVNLQGSTQCPQDSVSFSLMGKSYTLDMPYQPVCNALDFFRPAVLAVGAITSAFIIAGIRTKEDET